MAVQVMSNKTRERALRTRGVQVFHCAAVGAHISLLAALRLLASKGITRIMVEGGHVLRHRSLTPISLTSS
jgi:riboflavin biosynthesis pyrimidine reductase